MALGELQSNALTTLERLKLELGIAADDTNSARDTKLCELINAFSDWAESITGRNFLKQEYTETYPGSGSQMLIVNHFPVTSIEQITVSGEVVPDTEYQVVDRPGRLVFRNAGWSKVSFVQGMAPIPLYSSKNIVIQYTAGYVLPKDAVDPSNPRTLPYDIEKAVLNLISIDLAREGTAKGLKSFKISDVMWDFGFVGTTLEALRQISPSDYSILHKYRSRLL